MPSGSISRAATWRRSRRSRCSGCWAHKDLGVSDDYHTAKMPPVNTGLLDGQLAWRQHDGGHTDAPNVKYFIQWADKWVKPKPTLSAQAQ